MGKKRTRKTKAKSNPDQMALDISMLDVESQAAVERLIQKKKRQQQDSEVDEAPTVVHNEVSSQGRSQPRQPQNRKPKSEGKRSRQGRREPRQERNKRNTSGGRRGQGRGKSPGRIEAVQLSGENRFHRIIGRSDVRREREMSEEGIQEDKAMDAKLWKNRAPSQRRDEVEPIEVQCKQCRLWYDIFEEVLIDQDTMEANYTCNNCGGKG